MSGVLVAERTAVVPAVERVLQTFHGASDAQRLAGMRWYEDAHAVAVGLDGGKPRRAAGVIAALSPKTPWSNNLRLAERAYADGVASGTLGRSCAAADAILAGADPLDVLKGPKVRSFFTLINDPGDPHEVCVDRHAVAVAVGRALNDQQRSAVLARRGGYESFADCYREAGVLLGLRPAVVQAVTWTAWREAWGGLPLHINKSV